MRARWLAAVLCFGLFSCGAEERAPDPVDPGGLLDGSPSADGGGEAEEPLDAGLDESPLEQPDDAAPTDAAYMDGSDGVRDAEPAPLAEHRTAPRTGPWFEGWYTRVTDEDGAFSMAVICAVHLPEGEDLEADRPLSGYIAVLHSEGYGAETTAHEVFPEDLFIASAGRSEGYACSSATFGLVTDSEISLSLPGAVEVSVELGPWVPWDEDHPEVGPEGPYGPWPLPLHWHVMSLASSATYRLAAIDDPAAAPVEGRGTAHQEKNWGVAFPPRWIWLQGSRDGTSHVVVAGGSLDLDVLTVPAWLLGFRSSTTSWDFRPGPTTLIETEVDACGGSFALTARDGDRELRIEALAERSTFAPVSIPTEAGFLSAGGEESFSATVTVVATTHPFLPWDEPVVEEVDFFDAALEFGAANMCSPGG